jgi:hypothetical protein
VNDDIVTPPVTSTGSFAPMDDPYRHSPERKIATVTADVTDRRTISFDVYTADQWRLSRISQAIQERLDELCGEVMELHSVQIELTEGQRG